MKGNFPCRFLFQNKSMLILPISMVFLEKVSVLLILILAFSHIKISLRIPHGSPNFVHSKSFSYDDNGHGTHITGIAASSATFGSDYLGIAPKSHIVSLKVLDASGNGVQSAFLQGLDWIHEYHRSYQIRIVNISIGSPGSEDSSASKELLMMALLFVLPAETMVQNHTVFQFLEIVQKSSLLVPATIIFK